MEASFANVISADSHVMEPPDMWEKALGAKFGDRTPRIIDEYKGKKGRLLLDRQPGAQARRNRGRAGHARLSRGGLSAREAGCVPRGGGRGLRAPLHHQHAAAVLDQEPRRAARGRRGLQRLARGIRILRARAPARHRGPPDTRRGLGHRRDRARLQEGAQGSDDQPRRPRGLPPPTATPCTTRCGRAPKPWGFR